MSHGIQKRIILLYLAWTKISKMIASRKFKIDHFIMIKRNIFDRQCIYNPVGYDKKLQNVSKKSRIMEIGARKHKQNKEKRFITQKPKNKKIYRKKR